jgi:hypothetical protein
MKVSSFFCFSIVEKNTDSSNMKAGKYLRKYGSPSHLRISR